MIRITIGDFGGGGSDRQVVKAENHIFFLLPSAAEVYHTEPKFNKLFAWAYAQDSNEPEMLRYAPPNKQL